MAESPQELKYPFKEFCAHYDDVMKGDFFNRDRQSADEEGSFERTMIEVVQYMKTRFNDPVEQAFKTGRFMIIMNYLSNNIDKFDRGDYAVNGSERVGALASHHLLKAIHSVYTGTEVYRANAVEPTPDEMMTIADTFREPETPT